MKKSLQLILMLGICGSVNAQQYNDGSSKMVKLNSPAVNQGRLYTPAHDYSVPFSKAFQKNETVTSQSYKTSAEYPWYSDAIVGQTLYDLQTNSTVYNRIVNNIDGTISVVWTTSPDGDPYATRGTGYNYFGGESWGPVSDVRIESERTGFPALINTKSGKEYILAHNTTDQNNIKLYSSRRDTKGTGSWTSALTLATTHPYGILWAKTAVGGPDGESIHVIALTQPTQGSSSTTAAPYKGQAGAILYSRSLDGGATWDKVNTTLNLIDSTFYLGFEGDGYTIDAKGDTIVIVAGGLLKDVVLLKSTDNGDSWNKTIIRQFPIPKFNTHTMNSDTNADGKADTLYSNDGSLAALIDNSGLVHVCYGRMRLLGKNIDTLYTFPYTDGLYYWNENRTTDTLIASIKDMDGDGAISFAQVEAGTWPFGTYSQSSLTSFPSLGVDNSNRIYLGYSSIAEFTLSDYNKSFRHQYVKRSDDQGANWNLPLDVTEPYKYDQDPLPRVEGVFGSLARRVDSHVHLIYQRDNGPGVGVSGGTTQGPDFNENQTDNYIVYVKIPVEKLEGDVGIAEKNITVNAISAYPNPAKDAVNVVIEAAINGKSNITVSNLLGEQIAGFSTNLNAGKNPVKIDVSNYSSGIYFIKVADGNSIKTAKVIVD